MYSAAVCIVEGRPSWHTHSATLGAMTDLEAAWAAVHENTPEGWLAT
jgi:hypothetical protein